MIYVCIYAQECSMRLPIPSSGHEIGKIHTNSLGATCHVEINVNDVFSSNQD